MTTTQGCDAICGPWLDLLEKGSGTWDVCFVSVCLPHPFRRCHMQKEAMKLIPLTAIGRTDYMFSCKKEFETGEMIWLIHAKRSVAGSGT